MRALIVPWIVWAGVAWTGVARAAPMVDAHAKYQLAKRLVDGGEAEEALVVIEDGLVIAPNDLSLLMLKGSALLKLHDYPGALAAYQAFLDAGATGANRRQAQQIIKDLSAVQSTFLDVTLLNGPADIYLDSKTRGVFCTAAPSCRRPVMPGEYKVIAERAGFERWTGGVTIERGQTTELPVTLIEQRSLLTVRVAQPGARVTVDDTADDAPATVSAGTHRVVVSLAGHRVERREIVAHEGKPVELEVELTPLVAIRVTPPGAALQLDDEPVALEDGGLAIPPGTHVLVVRAPGFQDRRIDIPAERGSDDQLTIELARVEAGASAVAPPVAPHASGEPVSRTRRLAGMGGVVVGTVAFGVGFLFGEKARSTQAEVRELCGALQKCTSQSAFDRGHQLVEDARSQATMSTLLVAAGGAAVAAGVIVWLTAPKEPHLQAARVVPILSGNSDVGLAVAGRF